MAGNLERAERFVQDFQRKIRVRSIVKQGGRTGLIGVVMAGLLIYSISVRSPMG